ncbi:MAG: hypothetical protein B7Z74_11265, partial [Deltaproteobacteria bacterium 21-66-5]
MTLLPAGCASTHRIAGIPAGAPEIIYIETDTTWSGDVRVAGIVHVRKSATLTILPGTRVLFAKRIFPQTADSHEGFVGPGIRVEGRIVAAGTEENPILFTSEGTPAPASWDKILFTFSEGNRFDRCVFEGARYAFHSHFSGIEVRNCVFRDNEEGVRLGISRVRIEDSVFTRNLVRGINFRECRNVIRRNLVYGNGDGIFLHSKTDGGLRRAGKRDLREPPLQPSDGRPSHGRHRRIGELVGDERRGRGPSDYPRRGDDAGGRRGANRARPCEAAGHGGGDPRGLRRPHGPRRRGARQGVRLDRRRILERGSRRRGPHGRVRPVPAAGAPGPLLHRREGRFRRRVPLRVPGKEPGLRGVRGDGRGRPSRRDDPVRPFDAPVGGVPFLHHDPRDARWSARGRGDRPGDPPGPPRLPRARRGVRRDRSGRLRGPLPAAGEVPSLREEARVR